MAVRIRMARKGRTNKAFFRIGAYESRTRQNGHCLENLGWYDPTVTDPEKQLCLKLELCEQWLAKGARPTPKTLPLLKKAGVKFPEKKKKGKAKPKPKQKAKAKKGKGKTKGKAKAKAKSK